MTRRDDCACGGCDCGCEYCGTNHYIGCNCHPCEPDCDICVWVCDECGGRFCSADGFSCMVPRGDNRLETERDFCSDRCVDAAVQREFVHVGEIEEARP